ncbi:MAG: cellulase family glycosylhydrolase [Oscillospiraceae bacterium]|nr:cellulase family glycosylhydrolase [Oscillospiraceae bacterium]
MKTKRRLISLLLTCAMILSVIPVSVSGQTVSLFGNKGNAKTGEILYNTADVDEYSIFDGIEILSNLIKIIDMSAWEKDVFNLTGKPSGTDPAIFDFVEILTNLIGATFHKRIFPDYPPTAPGTDTTAKAGGAWTSLGNGRYKPPSDWDPNSYYVWSPEKAQLDWVVYPGGEMGPKEAVETTAQITTTTIKPPPITTVSVTTVSDSETAASDSETAASDSETAASDSDTPATESDTPASDSETAASDSETAASDSETAASDSETAASDSATTVSDSDTAVSDSDTAVSDSDTPATESDTPATESETVPSTATTAEDTTTIATTTTAEPCRGGNTNGTCLFVPWCEQCPNCDVYACDHAPLRNCLSGNTLCKKLSCEPACVKECNASPVNPECSRYQCQPTCSKKCNEEDCVRPWSCQDDCECTCEDCGIKPTHRFCVGVCDQRICQLEMLDHPLQKHSGADCAWLKRECQPECARVCPRAEENKCDKRECQGGECEKRVCPGENPGCILYVCQEACDHIKPEPTTPPVTTETTPDTTTAPDTTTTPLVPDSETDFDTSDTDISETSEISDTVDTTVTPEVSETTETYTTITDDDPNPTTESTPPTTVETSDSVTTTDTEPTTTTPPVTTTTVVTTTINVTPDGDTRELYNMKTDPRFADLILTSSSGHPSFIRGGVTGDSATVDEANKTVTIKGRSGSGQGLRFKLASLSTKPNHKYTIEFSGKFSNADEPEAGVVPRIRFEANGSSDAANQRTVSVPAPAPTGADGVFTKASATVTAEQIAADIAYCNPTVTPTYSLGNTGGNHDITYTDVKVFEICPLGCDLISCVGGAKDVELYNLQKDVDLFKIDTAANGSSSNPNPGDKNKWLQSGNDGTSSSGSSSSAKSFVDMGWKTAGVNSFRFIGTSSAHTVDIKLSAFTTRPNHMYTFEYTGTIISGSGGTLTLSAAPASSAGTQLKTFSVTADAPFTVSHEVSESTLATQKAGGATLIRLKGFSGRTVNFTGIKVIAQCPPSCTSCEAMPNIEPIKSTIKSSIPASLSAASKIDEIKAGWNLGNTFDYRSESRFDESGAGYGLDESYYSVTYLETSWISYSEFATPRSLFKELKKQGFNAVRIPVTWHKVADPKNNWAIRKDFMARVKEVVSWAMSEDMIVILNTHHENEVVKMDGSSASTKFVGDIWTQIANEFKEFNENLIFEGLNEPRNVGSGAEWDGGTSSERSNLNSLNQHFVTTVRATGGNNTNRILAVPTYGAGSNGNSLSGFNKPSDPGQSVNKIAMSVHIYAPFLWAHEGQGTNYPGSSEITTALNSISTRAKALGVPVLLGEFGSVRSQNDNGSVSGTRDSGRIQHAKDYMAAVKSHRVSSNGPGMAAIWWDAGRPPGHASGDGFSIIDRTYPHKIRFPDIVTELTK